MPTACVLHEQSTNHISLKNVIQSHPLHRMHLGQYQVPSSSNQKMETAIWRAECSQVAGLVQKVNRSSSKAPSLCAAVLHAVVFCSKILIIMSNQCANAYKSAEGIGSTNGQGLIWVRHKFGRKSHACVNKKKNLTLQYSKQMAVHTNIRENLYSALDVSYGSILYRMTADRHLHSTFKGTSRFTLF